VKRAKKCEIGKEKGIDKNSTSKNVTNEEQQKKERFTGLKGTVDQFNFLKRWREQPASDTIA
jgi:hypothetical protein